jgi:hypothetical protein
MQNPFWDDDLNVTPPTPQPPAIDDGSGKYTNWPSAEGYETPPDDWKPRVGRELPALRCTHEREDGSRCKNFGIRGTGFNGTPSMCFTHGGSLPPVKKKAEATLLAVRMMLVQNAPKALEQVIDLSQNASAEAIRLKASTEILDRAGIKGGVDISVEVTNNVSAADEIKKKLSLMAERMGADNKQAEDDLADLGEVDEPQED